MGSELCWTVPPDCPLTRRQLEVLAHVACGRSSEEVGERLGLRDSTVRTYASAAYARLGLAGGEGSSAPSAAAAVMCLRRGWFGWRETPRPDKGERASRFERAYLDAFDEHLRERTEESRTAMFIALTGMRHDKGVPYAPPRAPARDPLDKLLAVVLGIETRAGLLVQPPAPNHRLPASDADRQS